MKRKLNIEEKGTFMANNSPEETSLEMKTKKKKVFFVLGASDSHDSFVIKLSSAMCYSHRTNKFMNHSLSLGNKGRSFHSSHWICLEFSRSLTNIFSISTANS